MAHLDEPKSILSSAMRFLSGTLCSRISGMFRDIAMAFFFGSNPALAAFMVAFRFAVLFRRLFGESAIGVSFIPQFESTRLESKQKGAHFFRDLFFSMSIFLIVLVVLLEIFLGCIKVFFVSESQSSIITYMMLMLPGLIFICLFGLNSALLQCEKKYFLSGLAPVAFNIVWIFAVWYVHGKDLKVGMVQLSIAVAFAFVAQWLILMPQSWGYVKQFLTSGEIWKARLFSKEVRGLWKPITLSMVGVAAVQINTALDGIFARFASLEGPAYLWYAIRLQQVPLALFGIAIMSALLPPLSRAAQDGAKAHFQTLFDYTFRRTWALILPCTLGIFVLGASAVNLVYGRGDFSEHATKETIDCLWGYAPGLLPMVMVFILISAFQAGKDYKIPMIGSVLSVGVNILLNALFVFGFGWGAYSIAIATSCAAYVNCIYLLAQCKIKLELPGFFSKDMFLSLTKVLVCGSVASVGCFWIGDVFLGDATLALFQRNQDVIFQREFFKQVSHFSIMAAVFLGGFLALAWLLRVKEILELVPARKRQRKLPFSTEEN